MSRFCSRLQFARLCVIQIKRKLRKQFVQVEKGLLKTSFFRYVSSKLPTTDFQEMLL